MALKSTIPQFGLGTWKIPKDITSSVVFEAIKIGVRHLDCACDYGNEIEVGLGIKRSIDEGLVTREDLFITSKLWNTYHKREHVPLAARKSLDDLGISYFDLYLIHFPISQKFVPFETRYPPEWVFDPTGPNPRIELEPVPYSETWKALEDLVEGGQAKFIGVCNLNVQSLTDILSYAKIPPACNQVELHPYLVQDDLVQFCVRNNIVVTGFSPLGSPSYVELNMDRGLVRGVLDEPLVLDVAQRHNKTPAQVVLRWNVQRGVVIIPKSIKLERIAENFNIFDFSLTEAEMEGIAALDKHMRFNDPGVFCKGMGGSIPIYA